MKITNKTIQYALYDRTNGRPKHIADTRTYTRPPISLMTDTFAGAGIMGEIDLPTWGQIQSMEGSLAFKTSDKDSIDLFSPKVHEIEARWVTDALDTSNIVMGTKAHKEIIKYYPKSADLGTIETNTSNEYSLTYEILYYKYIVDGYTVMEIDKLNSVFKVNGVDYYAQIRDSL